MLTSQPQAGEPEEFGELSGADIPQLPQRGIMLTPSPQAAGFI
jgi:hypothetical protein